MPALASGLPSGLQLQRGLVPFDRLVPGAFGFVDQRGVVSDPVFGGSEAARDSELFRRLAVALAEIESRRQGFTKSGMVTRDLHLVLQEADGKGHVALREGDAGPQDFGFRMRLQVRQERVESPLRADVVVVGVVEGEGGNGELGGSRP